MEKINGTIWGCHTDAKESKGHGGKLEEALSRELEEKANTSKNMRSDS